MGHDVFEPRTAVREERRQANEALGRSFCKTLSELITNSDASAKRKHRIPQSSGLIDAMLAVPKGYQLDTAELRNQLQGGLPVRRIVAEVVTSRSHGRPKNQVAVTDEAQGMSAAALRTALEDIGGDRKDLADGMIGRNLFGRGLSDVMRAHENAVVHTHDGSQLSSARGEWVKNGGRWTITLDYTDTPSAGAFQGTRLNQAGSGTRVQFLAKNKRFHVPDPPYILARLANFYMLRLIAADPNVELMLEQYRVSGVQTDRITYDFPIAQVIERFTRHFEPGDGLPALAVDFLLARSERKLQGLGADRDARENGLLIVDEHDAVYDLTFVDPDFEKAEFLRHIFGIVRVTGLRAVLEAHLNSPDSPTSPLRVDRDGFNRDHEFSRALLGFMAEQLRPCYEKERKRIEEKEHGKLSAATRKRIDEALKHLNKYFQEITDRTGTGDGADDSHPPAPKKPVAFFPETTSPIVGRPRRVLLLVRDNVVSDGCAVLATASEGLTVQPETETIIRSKAARWTPHPEFFCLTFMVTGASVGLTGSVHALVESTGTDSLSATLQVKEVLEEPLIIPPEDIEFRPPESLGAPSRRNNMVLYVNPAVIGAGRYVRFSILKRTGGVELIDPTGHGTQQFDVKLDQEIHGVAGQNVLRVLLPWRGTAWNQHATVEARVKIGHRSITSQGKVWLDQPEPNEGGFFQNVEYDELDVEAPSMFAAGTIVVNTLDPLNKTIFGSGTTKEEAKKAFDRRVGDDPLRSSVLHRSYWRKHHSGHCSSCATTTSFISLRTEK